MLKGLLKIFLGDKSSTDIKEIQPVVDAINVEEKSLESLTADQLREKSSELKFKINDHIASYTNEVNELKSQAMSMSEADLDAKEAVFEKIDALELKINEELEVVLEDIMPEAFALIKETAKRFTKDVIDFGILICGSGIGISMAANRFSHIRAALCNDIETTKLARLHNDANILVLSGRSTNKDLAIDCINTFFNTNFEGGRHINRINKLSNPPKI